MQVYSRIMAVGLGLGMSVFPGPATWAAADRDHPADSITFLACKPGLSCIAATEVTAEMRQARHVTAYQATGTMPRSGHVHIR